jgi:hypothetical protein
MKTGLVAVDPGFLDSAHGMVWYGKVFLTSVVGTNSDPSDEIHLWIININSFRLPRLPQVPLIARPVKQVQENFDKRDNL